MTFKEYLAQCEMMSFEIIRLKERIVELRHAKDGLKAFFIKEISSKKREDQIAVTLNEIDLLESLYIQRVVAALKLKHDYQLLFDLLPDRKSRLLLEYKYIDMLSWEEIAEKLFYSIRNCHYLHKAALAQVEKIWQNNEHELQNPKPLTNSQDAIRFKPNFRGYNLCPTPLF